VAPSIPKNLVMTRKIRHRSAAVPQRHTLVVVMEGSVEAEAEAEARLRRCLNRPIC
jgi:hypothetical protein